MAHRPNNVLFILSDQHNAKVLGHKGHPDAQTPHLDRLAAEGVRFDNAITQNPICTPSRMCFISGQYCHNHGYYGLSGPNPGGLPTVFGHFRRAGYRTGAIGKIHCPEYWVEDDTDCFHETCKCSVGGRSAEYQAYLDERGVDEDHEGLVELGIKKGRQKLDGRPSLFSYEDSMEGWSVRKAMAFMGECRDEGKPFFAHVSLPKPHQCYTPAQEFWDLYDESRLTLPPNADYEMAHKPPNLRRNAEKYRAGDWTAFEPHTFKAGRLRKLHGYLGCVSQVDFAVGELMAWLKEQGLEEDTIVVYSADHGDYACEHGQMEKAPGIGSDAITRIPCIWRWPGCFKAGHAAEEIVETVDVANTLCALTGLDAMETSDGKDIAHLLRGESGAVREIGVTEFAWSKSVRKGKYRYVYYPPEMFVEDYPDGFGELYDLDADPWEMHNRYFDPEYAATVAELRADLLDWLITTTRVATSNGPDADLSDQSVHRFHKTVNHDGKIHPDVLRKRVPGNYL